jgi:2-polyprenyl-3-methyl-5-hydroxy-6-metoxy-1,4-benzoquinol methylase
MTDIDQGGLEAFYEEESARFDIWTTPRRGAYFFKEAFRYDRLMQLLPSDAKAVLDLGCGDGYLSVMLAERGHRVTALDLSQNRLDKFADKARRLGIRQLRASATDTGLEDASFDAVVSSEVLEHLPEPKAMLDEIHRLLAPGGLMALCVPNEERIRHITCPHCRERFSVDGHLHVFSAESLAALVREAGFEPVRTRTFRNKRTEKVRGGVVNLPYGAWVRWVDALMSRIGPQHDQYLAILARRAGDAP